MKKTQRLLLGLFWGIVAVALLLVVVFETGLLESGTAAGAQVQTEFLLTALMELATVGLIPLALWLFRSKPVKADLGQRKFEALGKWGTLRLLMLGFLLVGNTLLYYIYMNTAFGYMAIITLICLPFVYPSQGRCEAEVEL